MNAYELGRPPGQAELLDALAHVPPRLDLAALAIARLVTKDVDDASALATLDALGARVARRIDRGPLEALVSVLSTEEGFTGDTLTYHAPENSSLVHVLERKQGLPITLSVLYAEVGRRAGLEVSGIGLPGHFIAKLDDEYFDPFGGGRTLSLEDCRALVERAQATFSEKHLARVSTRAIVWRMVNNLKGTWLQQGAHEQALQAVDLLLAVSPDHPAELRLRASLLVDLGAFVAALADLERCLALSSDSAGGEGLRRAIESVRERIGRLH